MINDMKKSTDTRITQLENGQAMMGNVMKSIEGIQSTMGTGMKILEHNQTNIGTCMKNMETNQVGLGVSLKILEPQMEQLAQSLRENMPKSFSSDIEKKNPKQCMAVALRSGKELDEPKKNEKTEKQVEHKNLEVEEKIEAKKNKVVIELNNKGKEQKSDKVIPKRMTFPNNPPLYTPPLPFPQRF